MVRGTQTSIRLKKIQAVASKRGLSTTASRGALSKTSFVPRSKYAYQQATQQKNQAILNSIINKINTLSNINDINKVLATAPSSLSSQINSIKLQVENNQKELLSKLTSKYNSKIKSEEKYSDRRKSAKDADRKARYRAYEEEYEEEARALNKIINEVKSGKIYNYNSVISYVNDVGKYERQKEKYSYEKKKAEQEAINKTISSIKSAGYTPTYSNGTLTGYKSNNIEYRFDNSGNSYFYKSDRFTPVTNGGVITGYIDTVAKMSIPGALLDTHITNINKNYSEQKLKYDLFQTSLKNLTLPSNYSFNYEKGQIVSINDKNRGVDLELSQLPSVTKGYLFNPLLKNAYKTDLKSYIKSIPKLTVKLPTKLKTYFLPDKWSNFVLSTQYAFYVNNYNGKLSKTEFKNARWKVLDSNYANTDEGKKIVKALNKSLNDQIQNPDKYGTSQRITGLLAATGISGLPTAGMIVLGSTYRGTLGLAKDVSKNPLPKNFNLIAKSVAKNFGLGAVQGLLYGLAFSGGAKFLTKIGRPLLKVGFLSKAPLVTKGIQEAIRRGFSIMGANYVSKLAGRSTFNIKNITVGDKELGFTGLAGDIGSLVGFALPSAIKKIVKRKKVKKQIEIRKEIEQLEKLRQGQINQAYIKAKVAPIKTKAAYKSAGLVKTKLNKNAIKILTKEAAKRGITKQQLLDSSVYVQSVRVKSDVPKTEAILKILKGSLKNKKIKINKVKSYYEFKRYGVAFSQQSSSGAVKTFAIEFNYKGGKVSNIGFKTGVGVGQFAKVKVFKKAKTVKGKPIRAKLQDVYVVKNKFETDVPNKEGLVKTLNQLKIKKVFLNNKKLSNSEIIRLDKALKKDFALSKKSNLENVLKSLYKNKAVTGTAGYTNSLKIKRTKNGVKLIPSTKKAPVGFKIFPKGQYIEVGYSKLKIPTKTKIKVISPKIKPKTITKTIKKIPSKKDIIQSAPYKPKTITNPKKSLTITVKKTATKIQIQKIERAVKSIQTITKPITRTVKVNKVIPKSIVKTLLVRIGVLLPLVSSKNKQALRAIQSNLKASLNLQGIKQINQSALKQIKATQNIIAKQLKNISMAKASPITIQTTKITQTKKKTTKKTPAIATPKKTKITKKTTPKKLYQGYISAISSGKINKLPLTKGRAFDLAAYTIAKRKISKAKVGKSVKEVSLSTLNRKPKTIPTGFFKRNRSKFIVRKLKTRLESYELIKKPQIEKKPKKRKVIKKSTPKKRKVKKKK